MRNRNYASITRNDGADQSLFDLRSDGGQFRNIAGEAPQLEKQMFQQGIEGAGGSLPVYGAGRQMGQWYQPLIEGQHWCLMFLNRDWIDVLW